MTINIFYEDADVVVINKPSGVAVHRDGRTEEETIADWHVARVPEAMSVGEPLRLKDGTTIERPGIVHRLDRDTSGVMIIAKNAVAFTYLKQQFHDRLIEKTYRAFVYGEMRKEHGIIDRPIGKSAKDFRLRSAQRGARGMMRDALTRWELIKEGNGFSYLMLYPKTGRTHQLRVHMKAINHPIVSDTLYAPNHDPALGFSRLALHAEVLTLTLPSGETRTFTSPLPDEFLNAEEKLSR